MALPPNHPMDYSNSSPITPLTSFSDLFFHSIYHYLKVQVLVAQLCLTLRPHDPTRLVCPWDSPGKNPGVACCALLQGILLTQGSNPGLLHNPGLPHHRQILCHLSDKGKPIIPA